MYSWEYCGTIFMISKNTQPFPTVYIRLTSAWGLPSTHILISIWFTRFLGLYILTVVAWDGKTVLICISIMAGDDGPYVSSRYIWNIYNFSLDNYLFYMLTNFWLEFFNASCYSYLYILHTKLLSDTECQRCLPNSILSVPSIMFISFVIDNFFKIS